MPIVNIQAVVNEEKFSPEQVQMVSDQLGDLFKAGVANTWVKVLYLDRTDYAENQSQVASEVQPTFVEVLKYALGDETKLAAEAAKIAGIVGKALGRPIDNVHVIFSPGGKGRVAFGGKLVT